VLVFAAQLGFIFWLGDTRAITPRGATPAPDLHLAETTGNYGELQSLRDPTLFALPRREGFAGMTWLRLPQQQLHPFEWTEAPRWLKPAVESLGSGFVGVRETNAATPWHWPSMPAPEMRLSQEESVNPFASESSLRTEGENTTLLERSALPSWPAIQTNPNEALLLTNTVVQVMVNGAGKPVSTTLLVRSGSREADEYAVAFARNARFNSVAVQAETTDPSAGLRWCRLFFEWHTTPEIPKPAGPGQAVPGPAPAP
jgi:hypothetical protein